MTDIVASLKEFGADPAALHFFNEDGPELLSYATLITAQRSGDKTLRVVEAVYEWQGSPLIFLIDADSLNDDHHLHRIRRLLAMRGDAPYLGVVSPGRLDVYRIALDKKALRQVRVHLDSTKGSRIATLAQLGNIRPDAAIRPRDWISNVILSLLTSSINKLIAIGGISNEDAISLVGRALFTRFLADRSLLPRAMSDTATAASLFDNEKVAAKTSKWLDTTFNGDLLPLSARIFKTLPARAYRVLGDVLRRAPEGQLFLGWEEKWNNLDFAHIPVGVLSQAYELYLRNHAPLRQRREGGYYTPRPIADLMVRASFRALERQDVSSAAKILDPAAGAGVFLLTAFRELVAERWRADGKRPGTKTLRSILYKQIVGFDINEAALRFAALGLYLMSIELDPDPRPIDKLRFENLRGKVLHRVKDETGKEGAELGSLGPFVADHHRGQFDLVIGNPPWASGTKLPDWHLVREMVALIAVERRTTVQRPPLPNEGLDLPFVWRAMQWAKPNGQIAFALHARLLFQQGDGMPEARQALFEALDVTSIINGVELRQTKVWPEISAPFCLLFATNRIPGANAGFRLISPRLEEKLNDAGSMRIDATNAEIVPSAQLAEMPDILKVLFRGSKADLGIIQRIRSRGLPTLESLWSELIGVTDRGILLGSGNGYQKLRPSSRVRRKGDRLPGVDAKYLHGLPEVTAESFTRVSIDESGLDTFSLKRIHDPRSIELFAGPVVVVHKSPPASTGRIGVALSEKNVVFNETFYGYSPHGYSDAKTLAQYLTLVIGSKLAVWMALVTSGEFGFEREVIEKATLDRIPLPDLRKLETSQRTDIGKLFVELQSGDSSWDDVDKWVAKLYGLGTRELQVISDTLEFNLPFAASKRKAQEAPTKTEKEKFCEVIEKELLPWCERFGTSLVVRLLSQPAISPWQVLEIRRNGASNAEPVPAPDWEGLLRVADESAASEVLLRNESEQLLVGQLGQRRYWSETQARLLAQRIIWSHLDLLKGSA
jgi:N-6 DNA Methylase